MKFNKNQINQIQANDLQGLKQELNTIILAIQRNFEILQQIIEEDNSTSKSLMLGDKS